VTAEITMPVDRDSDLCAFCDARGMDYSFES